MRKKPSTKVLVGFGTLPSDVNYSDSFNSVLSCFRYTITTAETQTKKMIKSIKKNLLDLFRLLRSSSSSNNSNVSLI